MPESPTATGTSRGRERGPEAERVPVAQPEGAERTRDRPVYVPHVDTVETEDTLEIFAYMPGVTRDTVEVTLEQRVPRIEAWVRGGGLHLKLPKAGPAKQQRIEVRAD